MKSLEAFGWYMTNRQSFAERKTCVSLLKAWKLISDDQDSHFASFMFDVIMVNYTR